MGLHRRKLDRLMKVVLTTLKLHRIAQKLCFSLDEENES